MHIKTLIKLAENKIDFINNQMLLIQDYESDWTECANRVLALQDAIKEAKTTVPQFYTETSLRAAREAACITSFDFDNFDKYLSVFINLKIRVFS